MRKVVRLTERDLTRLVKRIIGESRLLNEQIAIPQGATRACYYGDSIEFMDDNGNPVGQPITFNKPPIRGQACGEVRMSRGSIVITENGNQYIISSDGTLTQNG
jgi:hypothetical protein